MPGQPVLLLLGVAALAPALLAAPAARSFKTCRRVTLGGCTCLDECAKSRWGGFVCSVQRGACKKAAFPHYDWCCPDKKESCCVDVNGRPHNYFASTSTGPTGQKSIHQQVKDLAAPKIETYKKTVDEYDTAITAAEDWALQAARQAAQVEVLKAALNYKAAIKGQAEEVAAMSAYDKAVRKAATDEVTWLHDEARTHAHGMTNATARHKIFAARAAIEETVMHRVASKLSKEADKAEKEAKALGAAAKSAAGGNHQLAKAMAAQRKAKALRQMVSMEVENEKEAAGLKAAAFRALQVVDAWDWAHQQAAYAAVNLAVEAEQRTRKAAHESHELLMQLVHQHQEQKIAAIKTGLYSTTKFRKQELRSAVAATDGNKLEERAAGDVERFERVVHDRNDQVAEAYEVLAEAAAPAEAKRAAQRATVAQDAAHDSEGTIKQIESDRLLYRMHAIADGNLQRIVRAELNKFRTQAKIQKWRRQQSQLRVKRGAMLVGSMIVLPMLACFVLRFAAKGFGDSADVELGSISYKGVASKEEQDPVGASTIASGGYQGTAAEGADGGGDADSPDGDLPSV